MTIAKMRKFNVSFEIHRYRLQSFIFRASNTGSDLVILFFKKLSSGHSEEKIKMGKTIKCLTFKNKTKSRQHAC